MDSSPTMLSAELDLDPNDPLNLLLRNSRNNNEPAMVSDWSTLWPTDSVNYSLGNMDLGLEFPPENMAIDPSALHFDSQKLNFQYDDNSYSLNDVLANASQFPFSFQPPAQRRLSVTSSSESSSGASLSPVLEHKPAVIDPALELAQRVRQSAGVMLAVPMQHQQHIGSQSSPIASTPPQSLTFSSASSAASTPPPSTPPPSFVEVSHAAMQSASGVLPRPKTSHTTIERRYRTNLNARIQSLRMAVPALRVLENQTDLGSAGGSRKVKVKVPVGKVFRVKHNGLAPTGEEEFDVVDERGFIDGVKVARKCSKANVLGKAVEYIRVLKKREARLRREQDGLKALVSGLVGGASLLNTWEKEWKEKFGGPERDELTDEDLVDNNAADAADSDEDDEDEDDDDAERKRKKTKTVPVAKTVAKDKKASVTSVQPAILGADGLVQEKRKRGRPRKTPLPPAGASQSMTQMPAFAHQEQLMQPPQGPAQGPAQYLLATFALFSFFNSPLTSTSYSSYSPTTHSGVVLSNNTQGAIPTVVNQPWGWRELIQVFHLVVSLGVLVSFALPWLPGKFTFSPLMFWGKDSTKPATSISLVAALDPEQRDKPEEDRNLRQALGVTTVTAQIASLVTLQWRNPTVIEGKAWNRLAEIQLLSGQVSSWNRIVTGLHLSSYLACLDKSSEQAAQYATLAMLLHPLGTLANAKTTSSWEDARNAASAPHEKLVMESLDVEQALALLSSSSPHQSQTPVEVLAVSLVKQRVITSLGNLFVHTVSPPSNPLDECTPDRPNEREHEQELERKQTIAAAKSLGGQIARLGVTLDEMWRSSTVNEELASEDEADVDDGDNLKALLTSISLFRSLFPPARLTASSALLSPPPSPSSTPKMSSNSRGRAARSSYLLRRALGSSVFEAGTDARLEDARDRVVDLLGELERRERRKS